MVRDSTVYWRWDWRTCDWHSGGFLELPNSSRRKKYLAKGKRSAWQACWCCSAWWTPCLKQLHVAGSWWHPSTSHPSPPSSPDTISERRSRQPASSCCRWCVRPCCPFVHIQTDHTQKYMAKQRFSHKRKNVKNVILLKTQKISSQG